MLVSFRPAACGLGRPLGRLRSRRGGRLGESAERNWVRGVDTGELARSLRLILQKRFAEREAGICRGLLGWHAGPAQAQIGEKLA